ncbi:MAG: alpha-amylase [Epulopiscium sp. Nele67-Bin004]|nr:MAG: alpha-amylase [Epulopiscium sp. Nele67-Bin004]
MELLKAKIEYLYPNCDYAKFEQLLSKWRLELFDTANKVDESTVYMITYGDSIYEENIPTATTLGKFADRYLSDTITDIHLLPMFEYTSDDGFSVVDYRKIDPKIGDWDDIIELSGKYRLMYDFVANHISKSSDMFQGFLDNDPKYKDFFIEFDEKFDYSQVIRPRTSPLFHEYRNNHKVLTTFSEDQIDLNFKNYEVFLETTDVLLSYAKAGATSIRLDAVGFMWKESGTSCMHLDKTHEIIKAWRLILDELKPNCQIITETNVPHLENISYFGNNDEANMVYQFALPPLVLYSFIAGDASCLTEWAKTIKPISDTATYFNFLSSHDGIGLRPTEGILDDSQRKMLLDRVEQNNGKVSYKQNIDGSKSVYELNINYHDALINNEYEWETQLNMIKAANAILLSVIGVPAIYYNTLLGSRNDYEGLEKSQINRRINREKFEYNDLCNELENDVRRNDIFRNLSEMIRERKTYKAFNPYATQEVLDFGKHIFAIVRHNEKENSKVMLLVNVSNDIQMANDIKLKPYEYKWILL